jgi:hypothetical protein
MAHIDRGYSPDPGENPLGLYVMLVITALGLVALFAVIATMIWGDTPATNLWPAIMVSLVGIGGSAYLIRKRAQWLAKQRNGDVIDREPWTGADLLPPV